MICSTGNIIAKSQGHIVDRSIYVGFRHSDISHMDISWGDVKVIKVDPFLLYLKGNV